MRPVHLSSKVYQDLQLKVVPMSPLEDQVLRVDVGRWTTPWSWTPGAQTSSLFINRTYCLIALRHPQNLAGYF